MHQLDDVLTEFHKYHVEEQLKSYYILGLEEKMIKITRNSKTLIR